MSGENREYFPCGETAVVAVHGEVDLASADEMLESLLRAAAGSGCGCLVVDLSRVRFFDASAIRALMAAYRTLLREGRHMVLAEPSRPAARTLDALGMEQVFDVYPIVEAALAHSHRRLGDGPGPLNLRG
ncbi:anti-anti-sigma factor [Spinactinospora alkalitolerans]|uniref:Anti-sigma factor antagonist n=1 Tax=Spinactinospora alkalitolerans TaxID=687207 RepID=A0A852TS84_9ACTN|nr:STAS domain-containing protein [Spinactinospora alkalitolerans]NYE47256.1 anti-anti-sigma factor [Spinactinospora alkalitolerans]